MNIKNDVFFQPLDRELRLAIANDLFCKFYDGEQYSPQLQLDIARKHSRGDTLLLMKLTIEIASLVLTLRKFANENRISELEVYLAYMDELKGKIKKPSWIDKLYGRVFN
jgi:hypothetical protein